MDSDDFRLSDDTMRNLRNIAQAPGELAWRMEVLAKLERMTMTQELFTRAAIKELKDLKSGQIGAAEIAKIAQREFKQALGPTKQDVGRLWKAAMWLLERGAFAGLTGLGVWLGMKH